MHRKSDARIESESIKINEELMSRKQKVRIIRRNI